MSVIASETEERIVGSNKSIAKLIQHNKISESERQDKASAEKEAGRERHDMKAQYNI